MVPGIYSVDKSIEDENNWLFSLPQFYRMSLGNLERAGILATFRLEMTLIPVVFCALII